MATVRVTTHKLPNPQQQADTFVQYLGTASGAPANSVRCTPQHLSGLLGTADDPSGGTIEGFTYIVEHLKAKGLVEQQGFPTTDGTTGYRLTVPGWATLCWTIGCWKPSRWWSPAARDQRSSTGLWSFRFLRLCLFDEFSPGLTAQFIEARDVPKSCCTTASRIARSGELGSDIKVLAA